MRAVLDTNVIVSAIFWGGNPALVFKAATENQFTTLASDHIVNELRLVLSRPKFTEEFAKRKLIVETVIHNYEEMVTLVEPADVPIDAVRDPKDRAILACALGGKADVIVSGDKDLLVLNPYENIAILNAEAFLKRLEEA